MAAPASVLGVILLFGLISRLNRRPLNLIAAILLPLAAWVVCGSWHCLLLIPFLLIPSVLDLPGRVLQSIPKLGYARSALIPESSLTQGAPQVVTLCLPFQPEEMPLRRKGGNVLFNTAVALCADVCSDAEGLSAYARSQGFEPARLLSRMPRAEQLNQSGLVKLCHQDAASLRWFVCGDPESLLPCCSLVLDGGSHALDVAQTQALLEYGSHLRSSGQALYAFACSDSADGPFTYLGMAGLRPLLNNQIVPQLARLQSLGVHPILWASSQPERAWNLACESGLVQPGDCLASQEDFAALSDEALLQQAPHIRVLQGLDRSSRLRFVQAFQHSGQKLLSLEAEGLAAWEHALLNRRSTEALSLRLKKLTPYFTYLPCAGIALGAALNLWILSLLAVFAGLGAWIWLLGLIRQHLPVHSKHIPK